MSTVAKERWVAPTGESAGPRADSALWRGLWIAFLTAGAVAVWAVFRADFWMWQYIMLAVWYGAFMWLGLLWPAFRRMLLVVLAISAVGVGLYQVGYTPRNSWVLADILQSTSLYYWMSGSILLSGLCYYLYLWGGSERAGQWGHRLAWVSATLGFAGLLIRWKETYVGHPSWGHIPVTDMYDAMVLLCVITCMLFLFYESQDQRKGLGAFAMPLLLVSDLFLIWVGVVYHQNQVAPVVPALKSFWIEVHVPSMFVAYANFYLAAMVGLAWLLRQKAELHGGVALTERLPSLARLEQIMNSMVIMGFLFFTAGTILGAVWAEKAWGGFWSWDPKETWSLIVWLNYAAYLHLRDRKTGKRPGAKTLAWWSLASFVTVTVCFIGVDLFLGGLHSYAKL